jgi:hypothetical protein
MIHFTLVAVNGEALGRHARSVGGGEFTWRRADRSRIAPFRIAESHLRRDRVLE